MANVPRAVVPPPTGVSSPRAATGPSNGFAVTMAASLLAAALASGRAWSAAPSRLFFSSLRSSPYGCLVIAFRISSSGLSSESSAGLNTFSYHHRPTVAASESRLQRSLSSVEYDVTSFRLRDIVPLTRLSISAWSERHVCESRRCGPACAPASTALGLSAWPVGGAVAWHGAARWAQRHESRSPPPLLERRTWTRLRSTVLLILSAISGFIPTAPAQHMRHCASL
jgi:hypothetical protein